MVDFQTLPLVAITRQLRDEHDATVYDLSCSGCPLTLRVSFRGQEPGITPEQLWRVDAQSSHEPDAVIVTACAAFRGEALDAVGLWWCAQEDFLRLPHVDWAAIGSALASSRSP